MVCCTSWLVGTCANWHTCTCLNSTLRLVWAYHHRKPHHHKHCQALSEGRPAQLVAPAQPAALHHQTAKLLQTAHQHSITQSELTSASLMNKAAQPAAPAQPAASQPSICTAIVDSTSTQRRTSAIPEGRAAQQAAPAQPTAAPHPITMHSCPTQHLNTEDLPQHSQR
jgi:hypothetical protein